MDRTLELSFGRKLADFAVPVSCTIRPIKAGEIRIRLPDGFAICDTTTKQTVVELPQGLHDVPLLIFDCDRSSVNLAMIHYLMECKRLLILYHGDSDHDDWNCVKTAAGDAPWYPWRIVATLAPVWAVDAGPFGTHGFGETDLGASGPGPSCPHWAVGQRTQDAKLFMRFLQASRLHKMRLWHQ